jgi:thioredoxin-like negative regulator of GroEL
MDPLVDQELFETFLGLQPSEAPIPGLIVIWFSAKWCGPCRRINEAVLLESNPEPKWYKCDIDQNNYTAGFCNIRSIPSFIAIADKKIVASLQSNDTQAITNWVQGLVKTYSK